MSCDLCRRTLKGFLLFIMGSLFWPITKSVGIPLYFKTKGGSKLALWLLSMYGYVRNPEWLSSNEREWCQCQKKTFETINNKKEGQP
jgi:hypothetical protein